MKVYVNTMNMEMMGTRHVEACTKFKEHFIHPKLGAHGGLFIGEIKGLITMSLMPLNTYPNGRVHNQGGNLHYYIT
jgi:hypothetical protein